MKFSGEADCPVDLVLNLDEKNTSRRYQFNNAIDTLLKTDWYQNEISFDISPEDCINSTMKAKVILYY